MQIHELTCKKNAQVDEAVGDLGTGAAKVVNKVRDIGGAIASPFKDVAQGYKSARQDQKVGAMADKAFRVWQNYVAQLEQSVAKGPAPTVAPATKEPATAPGATATTPATAPGATATTPATTKPNYGTQTGAGAKVAYNQPTGVAGVNATQPANAIGPKTPGVTVTTPGTPASTAPGQPITIGGQKLKPGTPEYEKLAKMPLRELQAPAAPVSPALAAFRARTDGKYEAYLRAFVQKNLLAGMGSRELVNSAEIDQAIKEISKPENADPAKQRPLWNDLVRAAALAAPAARSLTDRTGQATAPGTPVSTVPGEKTPADSNKTTAALTMTKDQISQWISRNSEDQAALSALLVAINSAGKA